MQNPPFKFLDSYTKADKNIFFGREKETEEIYSRLFYGKMLLIYGPSGSGKTSLLQCGVANRFGEHDWRPVFIRRKGNISNSINAELGKQAITPLKEKQSIKEKLYSLYLDYLTPIYLIFDQFEELFIFGAVDEKQEFVNEIKNILSSKDGNTHLIFSIREEYLANLTAFEDDIPELFENRIRIEKMKKPRALEAIEEPCKVGNVELEEGVSEKVLERLETKSGFIELTWLQVIMDNLYKKAFDRNPQQIIISNEDVDQLGKMGDVLGNFLDEQLKAMEEGEKGEAILKAMISSDGTKKQLTLQELNSSLQSLGHQFPKDEILNLLQHLINVRIISDKDDHGRYELKHDSLAAKIYEKLTLAEKELLEVRQFIENAYQHYLNRKVLLRQEDLNYIFPYQSKLILNPELQGFIEQSKNEIEKLRKRTRNLWIAGALVFILIMVGFSWWALRERNHAEQISIISKSNELAAHAINIADNDPTGAYLLAEKAYSLYPSYHAKRALFESYRNYPFYSYIDGGELIVSQNREFFITIISDSNARIWDKSFNKIQDIKHKEKLWIGFFPKSNKPQISLNSKLVATSVDSTIYIWDKQGNLLKSITVNNRNFEYSFSRNNLYLILHYERPAEWQIISIHDKKPIQGKITNFLTDLTYQVDFSYNDEFVIIKSYLYGNCPLKCININSQDVIFEFKDEGFEDSHIVNDSIFTIQYVNNNHIGNLDIYSFNGTLIRKFTNDSTNFIIRKIITAGILIEIGDSLYFYDLVCDKLRFLLTLGIIDSRHWAYKVEVSINEEYFAIALMNSGKFILTNTIGEKISEIDGDFVCFSQSGDKICVKNGNYLQIYNTKGKLLWTIKGFNSSYVEAYFVNDDKYLLLLNYDNKMRSYKRGKVYLWNLSFNHNITLSDLHNNKFVYSFEEVIAANGQGIFNKLDTINNLPISVTSYKKVENSSFFYTSNLVDYENNEFNLGLYDSSGKYTTRLSLKVYNYSLNNSFTTDPNRHLFYSIEKDGHTLNVYNLEKDSITFRKRVDQAIKKIKINNNNLYLLSLNGKIYIMNLFDGKTNMVISDSIYFNENNIVDFDFNKTKNLFLLRDKVIISGEGLKTVIPLNKLYLSASFVNSEIILIEKPNRKPMPVFDPNQPSRILRYDISNTSFYYKVTGEKMNTSILNYHNDLSSSYDGKILLIRSEHSSVLCDNNLESLFEIEKSNYSLSNNKEFIVRSWNNVYSIYPASPIEIIRLVKEKEIFGKIRGFTEEEKNKYGIID